MRDSPSIDRSRLRRVLQFPEPLPSERRECSATRTVHRPATRERLAAMGPWARSSCWALWALCALAGARELDPAACAGRFDVQRNKIIRTEESREMGARYLSELDVGARAECLRLCCETDACDVFVFEEKSPGSCYLFNCGPPEDFRCKFTAHGNFSSGVLALSRRLAELQDQERLAHHERELASLRHPPSTTQSTTPAPRSTAPPRPPPQPREPPPPPPTPRCSRYQFECRVGGECIAVYNACDGVPQCADGSDEAPELGCPPPPPPRSTPAPAPPEAEGGELWPHRLAQAQRAAGASHIFSHKGGLLQEGAFEAPPAHVQWPQRAWPPRAGEGAEGERGWGYAPRPDWPDAEPRRAWPVPPVPPAPPAPRPESELPLYMPLPAKTMPEMPMVYSSQQQTLRDAPKKGFELSAAPPPPRASPAPPPPPPPPPARVENTTKKKALQDTAESSHRSQAAESNGAQAAPAGGGSGRTVAAAALVAHSWPPDEHDGLSEQPPAAVLLLVLGSLMTASLGALLACRARAARRRRRAHPRLALDADYLVNGMYL